MRIDANWRGRLGVFVCLSIGACSLPPFNYRPLDAEVDRRDATPGDATAEPDAAPSDADVPPADAAPSDADVLLIDADAPQSDVDAPPSDADASAGDADVPASDMGVDLPASDVSDVVEVSEAACGDGPVGVSDASADGGVSPECPPLPSCSAVVTATPTGGAGTDASPYTGWETIPSGACRVEFPPGVYLVRQPVMMRSNLTVRCLSSVMPVTFRRDRAMMAADGGIWGTPIFWEANGDELLNVMVDGCTFDHEGQYVAVGDVVFARASRGGTGAHVNLYVQNNHFVNLNVTRGGAAVVEVSSGSSLGSSACLVVRNNEFFSPSFGTESTPSPAGPAIRVQAGEHVLVQGNHTRNHFGVYIDPAFGTGTAPVRDIQVVDNFFENIKYMAFSLSTQANAIARVDGGCPPIGDAELARPYAGVRFERNTITANLGAGDGIYAGYVHIGTRLVSSNCAGSCNYMRPWRDVSVVGNSIQGAPSGFDLLPDLTGREVSCVTARDGNAPVPYFMQNVRVSNNTFDGADPRTGTLTAPRAGPRLQAIGMRDFEMRDNRIVNGTWGALVSGENIQIVGNEFEALNQRGSFDNGPSEGSLNLLGARVAHFGPLAGESRNVTVSCNTFRAPSMAGVETLSGILIDRGVSGVTLARNTVTGSSYTCAVDVAAERGDGGVPDGGVSEITTTRVPSTMPARCP